MRMSSWVIVLLAVVLTGCGPYRATVFGYEMRDTEFALNPQTRHLDTSVVGPIDLVTGEFSVPKDPILGGFGEYYAVVGVRFPFRVRDLEHQLARVVEGFTKAFPESGQLRSHRRVDGPGFVGEEVVIDDGGLRSGSVDGTKPPVTGRSIHVRLIVSQDALFFLVAGADQVPADSREGKYLQKRRERFLGAFVARSPSAEPSSAPIRELTREEGEAITKAFFVLFLRG